MSYILATTDAIRLRRAHGKMRMGEGIEIKSLHYRKRGAD